MDPVICQFLSDEIVRLTLFMLLLTSESPSSSKISFTSSYDSTRALITFETPSSPSCSSSANDFTVSFASEITLSVAFKATSAVASTVAVSTQTYVPMVISMANIISPFELVKTMSRISIKPLLASLKPLAIITFALLDI
ncbi:hypothetical protein OGATHE_003579 [Ogataea polymorpha]|uniref:Uncharacterized protein n=1 Tax=Ogataea polymorpha TaxID=460523 RepID=A0A9P8P4A0_9ASCO|nr:hypothetical protein OGATHE_003579 [Ogataea polymorpha]